MIAAGIPGDRHRAACIVLGQETPRHHALEYLGWRDNSCSLAGQCRGGPFEDLHLVARSRQFHGHGAARHRAAYYPNPEPIRHPISFGLRIKRRVTSSAIASSIET